MRTHITRDDLEAWDACYTPEQIEALPESATIAEVLRMSSVPIWDRVWAVFREEVLTESELEEATHELLTEVFEIDDFYYAWGASMHLNDGGECGPEDIDDAQCDFWNRGFWERLPEESLADATEDAIQAFEKVLACRA